MPRTLLRLGFDGADFYGTQRQPGKPTVDGAVLEALDRAGQLAHDPHWRAQGRTDRGVSALDYPVAVDVAGGVETAALTIAGSTRGIVPWAGMEVAPRFDPRLEARSRTYQYRLPLPPETDRDLLVEAWQRFEGIHDVSSLARVQPGKDPQRTILSTAATLAGDLAQLTITGESFLWNQVRRSVGAALDVALGRITLDDLHAALQGKRLRVTSLAPAEGLMLTKVDLPVEVPPLPGAAALGRQRLQDRWDRLRQRSHVVGRLIGDAP